MEYAGEASHHTKRRGKIRRCEWCGQHIKIGEKYASWLWFDGGDRTTVYVHEECYGAMQEAASEEYGETIYLDGSGERPEVLKC